MTLADFRRTDARQANYARLDREVARRTRYYCDECNSGDGMVQWSWWNLAEAQPEELPAMLYRRPEDHRCLYEACPTCETVMTGYKLLTDEEVAAAVAAAKDRLIYEYIGLD